MSSDTSGRHMNLSLRTVSPLRIGGKVDPLSGRENSTVTFGNLPVVPGPSLKGALRAAMESYLISKFYDAEARKWKDGYEALRPCIPNTSLSEEEKALVRAGRYRHSTCAYSAKPGDRICPVCYFLGAPGLVGFVSVPFLVAESSQVESLYSLRIDRGTGTGPAGKGGSNRSYEVVRPNVEFLGTLNVLMQDPARDWEFGKPRRFDDNVWPDEWLEKGLWPDVTIKNADGLLNFLKQLLESIEIIGGYKSKGCGRVKIKIAEIN